MSEEELNGFTNIERRIMLLLADGKPHSRHQLKECLGDEMASLANLQSHISRIRKKVREQGQEIICEFTPNKGGIFYRHIRLLVGS